MLNRFRGQIQPLLLSIGREFSKINPSPNFWTGLSLITSLLAAAIYGSASVLDHQYSYYFSLGGGILLIIAGFFDLVDGSVARLTRKTSKRGSFLDSTYDKVSESVVYIGIAAGTLASPITSMITLALSLLVSYVRARAESLGVTLMGVGIGERAERLLLLATIGMLPIDGSTQWAVIVVSIVAGFTLVQRISKVNKQLSSMG
ncbi:MAG TPA: CDP-alcohol phosphatidyltransferase family protein [Nitrososphaeraceae archaeon]|nr:CDP-alcohol phosphatidyltransferase family protein [Nitrososphaeraceae archaeon]